MIINNNKFVSSKYGWDFLMAHTTASHFNSIVKYFFSASDSARFAKAIAGSEFPIFCAKTAHKPIEIASVLICV